MSEKTKQELINRVIEVIESDMRCNDLTVIEELLYCCPTENLIAFLPEEEWKFYNKKS